MPTMSSYNSGATPPQRTVVSKFEKGNTRKAIIMVPGWNGTCNSQPDDTSGTVAGRTIAKTFAEAGFPVASIGELSLWGNSTARTNLSNMKTNIQGSGKPALAGKVHLWTVSAGATHALNFAKNNPTLVQSICCVLPCVDIRATWTDDRQGLGLKASINTAYSGQPATADNPASNGATIGAVCPIRLYYSTTDPICLPAEVTAFASDAGITGANLVSMGAVATGSITGHDYDPAICTPAAMTAFFTAND